MSTGVSTNFNGGVDALHIKSTVRTVSSGDGAAILDVETGSMYSLNNVATLILDRLQLNWTPAEITASITTEFGLPEADIADDVDTFIAQLRKLGLIRHRHTVVSDNE